MSASLTPSDRPFDERLDRPVYLLFQDGGLAEDLALDLRQYGLRARTFVNLNVLRNAARTAAPAAILMDLDLLQNPQQGLELQVDLQEQGAGEVPVMFVGGHDSFAHRLKAVQAGGAAYFSLPVNRPALLHRLHQLPAGRQESAGRVLLVDDAEGRLTDAATALAGAGMAVERIDRPEHLLEKLAGHAFDLLVVSGGLRDMEPTELIQLVRQTEIHYPLPALILTPEDKRQLDEGATAAGVDAIVGLPIDPKDLVAIARARIRRAVGLRSAYSYLAKRDPVTGLFSLGYFSESLRHVLASAAQGHGGALLYVLVVEDGGADRAYATGAVSDVLRRRLPPLAVAAQVDTDGIAILLPGTQAEDLERLAQLLTEQLRELVLRGATPGTIRCRVGVTLLSGQQKTPSEAVDRARQAAELQTGEAAAPDTATATQSAANDYWTEQARTALRQNRFRLVYQPIASLSGQPTSFFEVFLRMLDEAGRDILPQEFMPAAERAGLARDLDQWVGARAIHVLEEQKALHDAPTLFVKVFPQTIGDARFLPWLRDQFSRVALKPDRLVFQITHRAATLRRAETESLARGLRELGAQLAIEHFGASGDTGPELIKSLKPDFVKLSPQLTHDIGTNLDHQKLVQAIAGHCRAIEARAVASLVQDAVNLSVLWRCGVEYIQGYFMQEPVDVFAPGETLS